MALTTQQKLRNQVIYEVYIRNHSESGTFQGVLDDLKRIKSLGVDIIWLMPIHPIGALLCKGKGCPYSIRDYRGVNPEYGTLADFKQMVDEAHHLGMKIIIDVVFNHTSCDSWLAQHHPKWFVKDSDGKLGRKIPDWTDVVDLDYTHPGLRDYLIDTLIYWAGQGVDGFRCDVASLVPIDFWTEARNSLAKVNDDLLWLAESCGPNFITALRQEGFRAHSDSELYQAFDLTYDYDVFDTFQAYLRGETSLKNYLELLRRQESTYPENYLKLRFLENHDQPRAARYILSSSQLLQWTAFSYFEKGTTLIYAGQEVLAQDTPSLFFKEVIDWKNPRCDFSKYFTKFSSIKKESLITEGYYQIHHTPQSGVILASYRHNQAKIFGIFNVEEKYGNLRLDCDDGTYENLFNGAVVTVKDGPIALSSEPVIFQT